MCGDLEPEDRFESDLYQRFRVQAHAMLGQAPRGDALSRYLDTLFADLLKRCMHDAEAMADPNAETTGYRVMAMQSLALARLAGFMAGHVALNEDPMRKVIEAMMLGYREADHVPERDHHGHDHDHDHDHPHDHDHGHPHGHSH